MTRPRALSTMAIICSFLAASQVLSCADKTAGSPDCIGDQCDPECGDQTCDPDESCDSCPADCGTCPPDCGNDICGSDEDCENCPADCGACPPLCGDFACGNHENCNPCEDDDPCTQTECTPDEGCVTVALPSEYGCGTTSSAAGWDFWLPNPDPEPYSGLWAPRVSEREGVLIHAGVTARWSQLNPTPGVYDWTRIDDGLAAAASGGFKVIIRLMTNNLTVNALPNAIPDHVMSTCGPLGSASVAIGKPYTITVPPLWDSCIQGEYASFMQMFFAQQYHAQPEVGGIYLTGISDSRGEEMNSTSPMGTYNLEQIGMTPPVLETMFRARFDLWAAGTVGYAWKVAWVGGTNYVSAPNSHSYVQAIQSINDYAYQLGFGSRGGFLESSFIGQINKYSMATGPMDDSGHYTIDETHAIHQSAEARYLGDEIENINTSNQSLWPHSIRVLLLRALQMRINWLWADSDLNYDDGAGEITAVANYYNHVAGKRADNSPDAWALLRSTRTSKYSCTEDARNFHRWLSQVEVAGSSTTANATTAMQRIDNGGHECSGHEGLDWNRMLADDGSTKMDFRIDRAWLPETQLRPVKLLITMRANGSSFQANYCSPDPVSSPVVESGTGDHVVTVVLSLGQLASTQCRTNDVDLEIEAVSGSPEIAFVRLVRLD